MSYLVTHPWDARGLPPAPGPWYDQSAASDEEDPSDDDFGGAKAAELERKIRLEAVVRDYFAALDQAEEWAAEEDRAHDEGQSAKRQAEVLLEEIDELRPDWREALERGQDPRRGS
jgi:hypothetical protein